MGGFNPNAPFSPASPDQAPTQKQAPPAFDPSSPFSPAPASAPGFDPNQPFAAASPESTAAFSPSTEAPKPEAQGVIGKSWDWLNSPLLDLQREGAGPIESGIENFASGLTSPLSIGLAVGTFGGSITEQLLGRVGFTAIEAAGAVQKAKLVTDFGFLAKYGFDLGTNTIPQLEMNWSDYRAATDPKEKQQALDRLEKNGTESILNAIAAGIATKHLAHDATDFVANSPKGKAIANEQYADAVYGAKDKPGYQETNQIGSAQHRQDVKRWMTAVPSDARQIAIVHNIEAAGDPRVLEARAQAAASNPATAATAQEYRDAKQLSPAEVEVRDDMVSKHAADEKYLEHLNLLPEDGGLPNHVPHKWDVEDRDPETGKVLTHSMNDETEMLKKRKFATIFDGEQAGMKATTKNAALLFGDYHERVMNLIARVELGERLASGYMNDGSPMAAPGHLFPGFMRGRDAPMTPDEVAKEQKSGNLENLLRSGRIYEVEPKAAKPPAMVGTPGLVVRNMEMAVNDARDLGIAPEEHAYNWKQRDYVDTGLKVWRPISEAEMKDYPTSLVTFGDAPFPPEGLLPFGERRGNVAAGIPTDQPARIPHVPVPLMAHPDLASHLLPMLESTRPKSALVNAFLKVTKETKSSLLALSPFHWATILNRELEAKAISLMTSPVKTVKAIFAPKDIDYYNLSDAQTRAIRAGTVVSSTRPGFSNYLKEGLASEDDSIINRIPLVGDFNRAIEDRLFGPHGWISSLKFDLFDQLSGEVRKSRPELTVDQADRIAASQVNNKFGGLNYTVMGRGASTQHALRALMLAPDFLESTGRSILDLAGGHGNPLLKSFVAFNLAQWMLVRGINYLVSGDTHPESGNAVLSKNGKREYSMRTTLGDYLHFMQKPKEFLSNRVNPIGVRAPAEIAAGEDELGNKITSTQEFWDTLRQVSPIPLQGLIPTQSISQASPGDKLLQSVGVGSRKKFSPAETLAHEISTRRTGQGAALEGDELAKAQLRYKLEDSLRTAINAHDEEGRAEALRYIDSATHGPDAKLTREEATRLKTQAQKYPLPLQSAVDHLSLADALQVWDKSSLTEKRALRRIIQDKIAKWDNAKHTKQQNDTTRQQVQAFHFSLRE